MGSDSLNLFNKVGHLGKPLRQKTEDVASRRETVNPASPNQERYLPKWSADQYVHTNTSRSFVKSWVRIQCVAQGKLQEREDIINYS